MEIEPVASVAAAVKDADIITLVTRATAPFLQSSMVAPGAHINAVGAVVPERAEFEPSMLARCAVVAADTVPGVRNLSREFIEFYGNDDRAWDDVLALSRVIAAGSGRPARSGPDAVQGDGDGNFGSLGGRGSSAPRARQWRGPPIGSDDSRQAAADQ